jgi:hypothetical protein
MALRARHEAKGPRPSDSRTFATVEMAERFGDIPSMVRSCAKQRLVDPLRTAGVRSRMLFTEAHVRQLEASLQPVVLLSRSGVGVEERCETSGDGELQSVRHPLHRHPCRVLLRHR